MPTNQIRKGSIAELLMVADEIPEIRHDVGVRQIEARIDGVRHLILVSESDSVLNGCLLGYEKTPGEFAIWIGGVLPEARNSGVAKRLMVMMEQWARDERFSSLTTKAANKYPHMITLLLRQEFSIVDLKKSDYLANHQVYLFKSLSIN